MPKPISFGKIEVNLASSMEKTRGAPAPETPFRILVMGDFSGRTNRGVGKSGPSPANQRPIPVDRDNLDEVLAKLEVEIRMPILGENSSPVSIRFSEVEDFHPDRLYDRLEAFQALKETRENLEDPSAFAAVANELQGAGQEASGLRSDQEEIPPGTAKQATGGLLDQIIEQTREDPPEAGSSRPVSEWEVFLQEIVRPHLVPDPHPQQETMLAAVDAAAGELMRTILHHPDFQALEAAWRGLYFLVSRLETDALLKIYLLDLSKAELEADLRAAEELRSTGIYRLLVEQAVETPDGEPWAVLAGNYSFGRKREDIELLGRMAKVSSAAGAPFIAAASDKMLCEKLLAETPDPDDWQLPEDPASSAAWQALRQIPEADYLGLVLPRFLLRLPYGKDTEPLDVFDFEEMPSGSEHKDYLWGNASLVCAMLLGQSFTLEGWRFRPGGILEVGNLALHIFKEKGESRLKPCAETLLSQRAAERILEEGMMPLLSFLNQDHARLARFQALAEPLTQLAGRWGRSSG